MKHILVLVLALSSTAGAADSYYVSGLMGYSAPCDAKWRSSQKFEVSTDGGPALFGAVGRSFTPFRAEVEAGYQTNGLDTITTYGAHKLRGDSTVWSGLLNGYFDFNLSAPVLAYATAGVGIAQVRIDGMVRRDINASPFNADDTVFAWQVGFGAAYPFTDRISLDARYRYLATSDLDFEGIRAEFATHIILIGLRVTFD